MIGYAAREIFTEQEGDLLAKAEGLVDVAPYELEGDLVRCHELARAVGRILDLQYCDGWFGMIDHSWLWTRPPRLIDGFFADGVPNVLDVYAPGRLPQVVLVASSPHLPYEYRRGDGRSDVRAPTVEALIELMRGAL
jgi:hypothetical protein